jgi:hypothetical protein
MALPLPYPVGTRVVFVQDVERYDHFIVPAGTTGTVTGDGAEGFGAHIKVDGEVPGLTDDSVWQGELHWSAEDEAERVEEGSELPFVAVAKEE